jgi:hypothetical protein
LAIFRSLQLTILKTRHTQLISGGPVSGAVFWCRISAWYGAYLLMLRDAYVAVDIKHKTPTRTPFKRKRKRKTSIDSHISVSKHKQIFSMPS